MFVGQVPVGTQVVFVYLNPCSGLNTLAPSAQPIDFIAVLHFSLEHAQSRLVALVIFIHPIAAGTVVTTPL
jgi:hypothetical protein